MYGRLKQEIIQDQGDQSKATHRILHFHKSGQKVFIPTIANES